MYQLIKNHKNYSLHFMVVILGLTGVFGKLISLESLNLVWYRMLIAFLSLFIYLLIRKEAFSISKIDFFGLLGVGVLVTLHWIFFFGSIKETGSVSIAVVCLSTSSLFSALIEPLFFERKLLIYELVMGLVVIIALIYILGTDSENILGYIYGVLAAFFGTMFTLFNAKYINKVSASKITMVEMLSGVIIISAIFVYNNDYTAFTNSISFSDFSYLLILGILCTSMIFVWMTEIMKYISPYSLIMAINMEPIYSIILALIIFGESEYMSTSFYIGSFVIIITVFLESYFKNKQ